MIFLYISCFCCYVYVQRWNRKSGENKNYCWARSWAACGYYCMIFGSLHSARVQPSSLLYFYVVCICAYILKRVNCCNNDSHITNIMCLKFLLWIIKMLAENIIMPVLYQLIEYSNRLSDICFSVVILVNVFSSFRYHFEE